MIDNAADVSAEDLFLKSLRQKTAASHAALEANPLSMALVSPSLDLHAYNSYLVKMYEVMSAVETNVFPIIENIYPAVVARKKAHLILKDLGIFSFNAMEHRSMELPVMRIGEALGCLYVTEGSTLGGRFLYKHVEKMLSIDKERGASFFWGYGEETGRMWKEFISFFTRYAVEYNCKDEIERSAVATFTRINEWMTLK